MNFSEYSVLTSEFADDFELIHPNMNALQVPLDSIFNNHGHTVDVFLAVLTILHLLVAMSFVTKSETAMRRHYAMTKPVVDFPFLVTGFTLGLTVLTIFLCYQALTMGESADTLRAVVCLYTWMCSIVLQKISWGLSKLGPERVLEIETEVERADLKKLVAPPNWMRQLFFQLDIQEAILRPDFTGLDNVSTDSRAMYVMNHSLYGFESPTFLNTILKTKNVFLRGLADRFHFQMPYGELLQRFGSVNGTRDNVDGLMEGKQNILVYPGGGHEVLKPSTVPKYQLMWKERLGFARCAIKHGYPIIPCCAVGTEDMVDIMFDIDIGFARKGLKLPVPAPILPHRLQREYYWIGEPIPTSQYQGEWQNDDYAREVRDKVKEAVEAGIKQMKQKQANDPDRYLRDYVRNAAVAQLRRFWGSPTASSSESTFEEEDSSPPSKPQKGKKLSKKVN